MKTFKFNEYQIQNSEPIDNVCSQCCATPRICRDGYADEQGEKVCIPASSKANCDSKTAADFGFDDIPNICENPFYKKPTYGGIVDSATTATCYFDKDGDGCLNILTCQQMKKPGKSMTECACKDECIERGGEFNELPPGDPESPCGGSFINGKCGPCDNQEEPTLPTEPGFPPGGGGGGVFPPGPPSPPSPPSPPPPGVPGTNPWGDPPTPPEPPDGGPSNGPSTTCPDAHTLEVESTIGFDPNGGVLEICDPEIPSSCFSISYEYISGNIFIGILNNNNNQSILENYTVTQNGNISTAVEVGVISYDSCGLNNDGDLICCPSSWIYTNGKCCPPV
jgi:hypothetical protein